MKKRISAAFAALLILTAAAPMHAAAEDPPQNIHISVETKELLPEEIPANRLVDLKVSVENLPAFRTLRIMLEKDAALTYPFPGHLPDPCDALARVGGISCSSENDPNTNYLSCMIDNVEPDLFSISGEIMTLHVSLPDDAQPGDFYSVRLLRTYDKTNHAEVYVETDEAYYGESYFTELTSGGIRIVPAAPAPPVQQPEQPQQQQADPEPQQNEDPEPDTPDTTSPPAATTAAVTTTAATTSAALTTTAAESKTTAAPVTETTADLTTETTTAQLTTSGTEAAPAAETASQPPEKHSALPLILLGLAGIGAGAGAAVWKSKQRKQQE